MSILADLASRAEDKIADGGWVDGLVAAGRREASRMDPTLREATEDVLNSITAAKPALARTGAAAFAAVVSRVALGQEDAARIIYLREKATFEERMAAMRSASEATRKDAQEREEAWEATKALAKDILKTLGKAAVPLLLAAI